MARIGHRIGGRCNPDKRRGSRDRRRITRQQAQENIRAHAHSNAAQALEEKSERGEIADAETNRDAGKIAFPQKKGDNESDSNGKV